MKDYYKNLKLFYSKKVEETLLELEVDENTGLTLEEVAKRQEKFGKNEFSKKEDTTLLKEILKSLKEPMMVILLIAAFISLLVGETHDAIGIVVAMSVGIGIGIYTEGKSKRAAEALASLTKNVEVKVVREGIVKNIKKDELVPGDIVYIETGDSVPADGRLFETVDLKVREDMLTGEADDITKNENFIPEKTMVKVKDREVYQDPVPAQQINMVFSGTLVAYGRGKMIVTATGDNSEMGEIAKNLNTEDEETPIQRKLGDLSAKIAKVSGLIATLLFIFICSKILINKEVVVDTSSFINFLDSIGPIKTAFITCIALIVAAVPEGLPTMVNVTLAVVMQRMANINALVTKKEACETIGSVSVICSDKTGTLTENRMTVEKVNVNGEYIEGKSEDTLFLNNCLLNSTADISFEDGKYKYLGSATECALLLHNKDIDYRKYREENIPKLQVPFSSSLKRMATVIREDGKDILLIKGAPEILMDSCSFIREGEETVKLTKEKKENILKEIEILQGKSMRTLGFIYKVLEEGKLETFEDKKDILIEENMIFQGFVGIKDPLREGVRESILKAKKAGVETKMLTGDNINTAIAIGEELGLLNDNHRAVESGYIDALTDDELCEEIKTISIVGRSKPDTKMRIVKALQKNGEVVGVTGDGINDAPALKKADVGIAMGIAGTEVSKGAADIILTDDSFSTIVEGIKWGRSIYDNFQRFIQFQLTVNVVAFLVAIVTQLLDKDMPFTTIQLLWVNIIMDGPPAIALGLEPVRNEVLNRLPKRRSESIISKSMLTSIVSNAIYITIILIIQMQFNILGLDIEGHNAINEMTTSMFAIFALSALFNAFNAREIGVASVFKNFFKNRYAVITILVTLVVQILVMNLFASFFNVVILDFAIWVKIILLSLSIVIANEFVKLILRTVKK